MSNESLTCSNSSFIVDLPIIIPNSNTFLVVESQTSPNVTQVGKVSLPEALLRSGIPLTGTQVDTWVQDNSCNIAAATAWFLVNNIKTSKANTWTTSNSSLLLSATSWVTRNSARLETLNFTTSSMTDTALQAGLWVAANSSLLLSLTGNINTLSADDSYVSDFTNWVAQNSAILTSTITAVTSHLVDEAEEQSFISWITTNSSVFNTALTTLNSLTGDEGFIRNASHWTSTVSADVESTLTWFKVLTSVKEAHDELEATIHSWVTSNSAEVADVLEKNSQGFISWVSVNSADHASVYNWFVENNENITQATNWTQTASDRVTLLEGAIGTALETAIDANTWIDNNKDLISKTVDISAVVSWVTENSAVVSDLDSWYNSFSSTEQAIEASTNWIDVNGANVIQAANWIDTLVNNQNLHDHREEAVLAWVEANSAGGVEVSVVDPNATTALTWLHANSALILQTVNWVDVLTSTQSTHESREDAVFAWVETNSSIVTTPIESTSDTWVRGNSASLSEVRDWYTANALDATTISPVIDWVNSVSAKATQAAEWVDTLTEAQNQHDAREDGVFTWVEGTSGIVSDTNLWVQSNSASITDTYAEFNSAVPFLQSFKDSTNWYQVSSDFIDSAVAWIASVTSTWVSQIQLEALQLIFNSTKTWVVANSGALLDNVSYTQNISADITNAVSWIELNSQELTDVVTWVESNSATIGLVTDTVEWINNLKSSVPNIDKVGVWVQTNSSSLLKHSDIDLDIINSVTSYTSQISADVDTVINWYNSENSNIADAVNWVENNSSTLTASAASALQWIQDNSSALQTITDTAESLDSLIGSITPITNWVGSTSAEIKSVTNWVESNSSLAEVNNILNDATSWVSLNSGDIHNATAWVTILTSTQQLHDNREEGVFTWVETNSSAIITEGGADLTWVHNTKDVIANTVTWVNDNSSNVQDTYITARAAGIQATAALAWLQSNSATILDTATWTYNLSSNVNFTAVQDAVNWVVNNSESLSVTVENLVSQLSSVSDIQTWIESVDTQDLNSAINWVVVNSSDSTHNASNILLLSSSVTQLIDQTELQQIKLDATADWVASTSATIQQTNDWVSVLSSTQQLHDGREETVFTWVEANSSNIITPTDHVALSWVQSNSSTLESVEEWYNTTEIDVNKLNAAADWVATTSALATQAADWVQVLSSAQNQSDAREEAVLAWVEANSSAPLNSFDEEPLNWVRDNSATIESIEEWYSGSNIDTEKLNAVADWVTTTSALATQAADWVQVLSSAQHQVDVREEAVFAWVEANSSQNTGDTAASTWVQANSSILEGVEDWTQINTDEIDSAVAWVNSVSALTEQTNNWISVLSSTQHQIDNREEDVITWVQSNSSTLESVEEWYNSTEIDVNKLNAAADWVNTTSALATQAADWVQLLSSAQQQTDAHEQAVIAWVEANSSITQTTFDEEPLNWVRNNSGQFESVEGWIDANTNNLDAVAEWVNNTSAIATQTAEWIQVLSSAQHQTDVREEAVIAWVEANSGTSQNTFDEEPLNWVRSNSATIETIEEWYNTTEIDIDKLNAAADWVATTSALATQAADWVQVLSSAQHQVDVREEAVIAWVEANSSITQTTFDEEPLNWVRSNSGTLESIEEWYSGIDIDTNKLNAVADWVVTTSALATQAADWVQVLSSAQHQVDVREEAVLAWVETNSAITLTTFDETPLNWVRSNSATIESIEEWYSGVDIDTDNLNAVASWVNTTSALATQAADWVQVLSSAQHQSDAREEAAIAWVETNSAITQTTFDETPLNWVRNNSGTLETIEEWYNGVDIDSNKLNAAAEWVANTSALATQAAEWVQVLSSAQHQVDLHEQAAIAWVEANSSITQTTFDEEPLNWVRSNSATIESIEEWYSGVDIDTSNLNAVAAWVNTTSALATQAADWVQVLSSAQHQADVREEAVIAWVEANSSITQTTFDEEPLNWVRSNSATIETIEEWYNGVDIDTNKLNAVADWVTTTSALATQAADWVQVLSSAQHQVDVREEAVLAWVEANSSITQTTFDETPLNWVRSNSGTLEIIEEWYSGVDIDTNNLNAVAAWVNTTSALATQAADWVQVLSSAVHAVDSREEAITTWVEANSASLATQTDVGIALWVQGNSAAFASVEDWYNTNNTLSIADLQGVISWVNNTSSLATQASTWVQILSTTQQHSDSREQAVLAWVEANSANTQTTIDEEPLSWVRNNSGVLESIEEWYSGVDIDTNKLNAVADWVTTTSALATQAADWVQVLSSAQQALDTREEAIFAWVEANSSNTINLQGEDLSVWVQANSSTIQSIEAWYNLNSSISVNTLTSITDIVDNVSDIASQAATWISILSSAQNIHDNREENVFAWVEANSSTGDAIGTNTATTWIQNNSTSLAEVKDWYDSNSGLIASEISDVITWVNETSALAVNTANWFTMLSSAQQALDTREEGIFAWVEANSAIINRVSDNSSQTWVQTNSALLKSVTNWFNTGELNVQDTNNTISWVNEFSEQILNTVSWVAILTSTQQLHDNREDAVFTWVETNSGALASNITNVDVNNWVQGNSSVLADVSDWFDSGTLEINDVNASTNWVKANSSDINTTTNWVTEYSQDIEQAISWVNVLSSTLNNTDSHEDAVIAWVEANSGNFINSSVDISNWVQNNSATLISLEGNSNAVSDKLNDIISWVSSTSATTEQASNWVQVLSSAQQGIDAREEAVLAWVEANSGKEAAILTSADVNTWVQSNSGLIAQVEDWYSTTYINVTGVNNTIEWVNTYGSKAVQAADWIDILNQTTELHEGREDAVFAWVEENSGNVVGTTVDIITWVESNSGILGDIKDWYDNTELTQTNYTDLTSTIDWVNVHRDSIDLLNIATTNTNAIAISANRWVTNNATQVSAVNAWVRLNSANVRDNTRTDAAIAWVESNQTLLSSIEDWYIFNTTNQDTILSAVSWVQTYSARAEQAALWFEAVSAAANIHDDHEEQVITWVENNSGIKAIVNNLNTWALNTSDITIQVDNWVITNSADITSFATWWRFLSGLEEGHADLENQVIAWVCAHSGDIDEVDAWVRNHSAGLIAAESWVENTTAFFKSLSTWAITSSANYEAAYSWTHNTSARVISAVTWVEEYSANLTDLYNFYYPAENFIDTLSSWYYDHHIRDDDAGDWVFNNGEFVVGQTCWLSANRPDIANIITWGRSHSGNYEASYTWVRDHSGQVANDHDTLVGTIVPEVASHESWIQYTYGPMLIQTAHVVQNMSAIWILSGGGGVSSNPCDCYWDKVEPITNPLGLTTYHQVLTGKTLKQILELILYTDAFAIKDPQGRIVCPNTTISFEVSAYPNDLPITYQWYKDDGSVVTAIPLPGGSQRVLTLAATKADEANYFATATNGNASVTSKSAALTIKDVVGFIQQPSDKTLVVGDSTTLSCTVTGAPPVYYQWTKNNVAINGATGPIYTFGNPVTASGNIYAVSAYNICSVQVASATVVVNAPVAITRSPDSTAINVGQTALLTSTASGSPVITYQWLSTGDVPIPNASSIYLDVQLSGTYKLVATNMVNSVTSAPAFITFNVPPVVTITPTDPVYVVGNLITLNGHLDQGTLPVSYQWYKDGVALTGATSNTLTYTHSNAITADGGVYMLSAGNMAGSNTAQTTVTVNQALRITRNPASSAINFGDNYTIYSTASGTEPITYQWQKDGVNIAGASATSTDASTSGTYRLFASNVVGTVSSSPAVITYNVAPLVTVDPHEITLHVGTDTTLTGTKTQGTEPVYYQWYKGGVAINGATSLNYNLTNVTTNDIGTYTLSATNMAGNASDESNVNVIQGLIWLKEPSGVTYLNAGQTKELSAVASGTTPITYQWLSGADSSHVTTLLNSTNVTTYTASQSGYYRAKATNIVGTITSTIADIEFNVPPRITVTPSSSSILTGNTIVLHGTLNQGTPTVTYQWFKNGTMIPNASALNYTLTNVVTADTAVYTLSAGNIAGSDTATSDITVNQALTITRNPAGSAINSGDTYTLFSSASGTEPIAYQWVRNSVGVVGASSISYDATLIGTYVLVASNVVGTVSSQPAIITYNIAPVVTVTPSSSSILTNTTLLLHGVKTQGTEPVYYKWLKNGIVINGATSLDYTLTNATTAYTAVYTLSAGNMAGSATAASDITVNQALSWLTQPGGTYNVNPGVITDLSAIATGTEPITYQWLSGVDASHVTTQIVGATGLVYSTAQAGSYKSVATNLVGSITSTVANIAINSLSISLNPVSHTVTQGDTVTFTSSAIGTQPISYTWHFNGNIIPNATDTTLTLTNVQAVSAGSYVLEATNIVGSVSSTIATLTVNVPTTYTMYWGKIMDATAVIQAPATNITTSNATIAAINTWYSTNALPSEVSYFPLGAYSSGLVAIKDYTGFKNKRINTEDFNKVFQCDTIYSSAISVIPNTSFTVLFPQTPEAYRFTNYFASSGHVAVGNYQKMIISWSMIFIPVGVPGNLWTKVLDESGLITNTILPSVATPRTVTMYTNGVSAAYYSYLIPQTETATARTLAP